jgi:uncharacterized protein YlxP (DUF503 family)
VVVSVARVALVIPHSHSLKEKRAVIRKLVDRTRARFDVRISEVGGQDTWQRAVLGFAVVSGDRRIAESVTDDVIRAIENQTDGEVVAVDREILNYGEGSFA